MSGTLVVRRAGDEEGVAFRRLTRPLERLRGLLGTGRDATPVALMGCHSIHTFGMSYLIDVAFVDACGRVVASRRHVEPARLITKHGACMVLERPHRFGCWYEEGERLEMESMDVEQARGADDAA